MCDVVVVDSGMTSECDMTVFGDPEHECVSRDNDNNGNNSSISTPAPNDKKERKQLEE